jgi:hypothetical protein
MAKSNATSSDERRPSPTALLELAEKENRGKLKVFLGMAPGVGKTFAMLSAARAQRPVTGLNLRACVKTPRALRSSAASRASGNGSTSITTWWFPGGPAFLCSGRT